MSTKHRYAGKRPPDEERKGLSGRYARDSRGGITPAQEVESCTCWLIIRGDGNQTTDRHTADCELVPDPSCPIHGKKHFPILEDDG